ncbi:MAG: hypothetical protein NZT92_12605 [Abditibacteriales bacterium]|nr:hypothetical protein [Abditibacteriales bacterium]MDW8366596.1 hypothetical protein [Abditibacteriales bacterium]
MRTTRQVEIAATVHFVAKELTQRKQAKPTEVEVLNEAMKWKQKRRPPLDEAEVASVIRNLAALGWLDVEPSADLTLPAVRLPSLTPSLVVEQSLWKRRGWMVAVRRLLTITTPSLILACARRASSRRSMGNWEIGKLGNWEIGL